MALRFFTLLLAGVLAAFPADYHAPAGERTVARRPGADSIIPGGRFVHPYGEQHFTGPGPFGLTVSPDGNTIVTADGGPGRYSLTVLNRESQRWQIRTIAPRGRDADDKPGADDDDDWRAVFMGLAFDGNDQLYASEGNSGAVRRVNPSNGKLQTKFELNQGGARDSYSADLAYDSKRGILYVVDQANFRVAVFDTKRRRQIASLRVGRLPFAATLSPNGERLYVTNLGMFEYQPLPGADRRRPRETGLAKPPFAFPSPEAEKGIPGVPGLGSPNHPESNSLCVIDVADPANPKIVKFIKTGLEFGESGSLGGASPSGVVATPERIYVSNAHNDSITVIDAFSLLVLQHIPLRVTGLENLRGFLPIGMAFHAPSGWLLVAEAGMNAIAVVDPRRGRVLGHIPAGWFPTRVAVDGNRVYVVNAKGAGTGPNADKTAPFTRSFQAELRRGSLQSFLLPKTSDLEVLTAQVWIQNGAQPSRKPALRIPEGIKHVVLIVKENRTFDEMFGDIESVSNGEVRGAPELARFGRRGRIEVDRRDLQTRFSQKFVNVAPNHRDLALKFAFSDNFYADAEVSVDGHHWLIGSYPNAWTESSVMAGGSQKDFRLSAQSPGRLLFPQSDSSLHPEEQLEAGAIWHHLERNGISFRNYGEGFELAGSDEGPGLKPTGTKFFTNLPVPKPLYDNTCWDYPGYNTNIPDQYRASQFIKDVEANFVQKNADLPRFLYIHLPNDHIARPRPSDGYPFAASYVADNDYALGRIVEYLSHSKWWPHMAIFVTEDDAQGGVDHVDSHRSVFMAIGPHIKRHYVSRVNSSFPGLLKTIFRTLGIPPLNLFDALASDLADVYSDKVDLTPHTLLPVNAELFDPSKAKDPSESTSPSERMDSPSVLREQHQQQQQQRRKN